jgi:hypothetical protein
MKLFDPTSSPAPRDVTLAPRPADLRGLKLGLVENTKFNSIPILAKLGERLRERYGVTIVTPMTTKRSPSHEVSEAQVAALRRDCHLVISGIGD